MNEALISPIQDTLIVHVDGRPLTVYHHEDNSIAIDAGSGHAESRHPDITKVANMLRESATWDEFCSKAAKELQA